MTEEKFAKERKEKEKVDGVLCVQSTDTDTSVYGYLYFDAEKEGTDGYLGYLGR